MLIRLSFVFVQLLLLPHRTTINASGDGFEHAPTHGGSGLAMTQPILTPFCNLTTVASSNEHQMSWLTGRPRGTSTSSTETTRTRNIDSFFSGQVGSSTTCNMLIRLSFVFVQVNPLFDNSHCYRSDDRFLLLLPCPQRLSSLLDCIETCVVTFGSLLCYGDVESNPGPMTRGASSPVRTDVSITN
uniref:Secreted protein n=1 Tax=Ixodes ricinus TaxID=34613 RepID=A0A6B0UZN4_IXORI